MISTASVAGVGYYTGSGDGARDKLAAPGTTYYTGASEKGEPPGRWSGRGRGLLLRRRRLLYRSRRRRRRRLDRSRRRGLGSNEPAGRSADQAERQRTSCPGVQVLHARLLTGIP